MAEVLISPGVLARENDQSFLQAQPVQAGAAIVGPTVKGPVGIPTLVTTYSDYQNVFGAVVESGSAEYTYLTSISAYNYFQQGGDSLLVTRVVSGSFTSATSTTIGNADETGVLNTNTNALLTSFTSVSASVGTYTVGLTGSASGTGAVGTVTLDTETSISSITLTGGGSGYVAGEVVTCPTASGGFIMSGSLTFTLTADDIVNTNAFILKTISEGEGQNSFTNVEGANNTLSSGSADNVRLEIVDPDTS